MYLHLIGDFEMFFFLLLMTCANLRAPEGEFLDHWWSMKDLSEVPDGVDDIKDGTCFILRSDGRAQILPPSSPRNDVSDVETAEWSGNDGKYDIFLDGTTATLRVTKIDDEPTWDISLSLFTYKIDGLAVTCWRVEDILDTADPDQDLLLDS